MNITSDLYLKQFKITLASFLHDIGKFKFRCLYSKNPKYPNKISHDELRNKILTNSIFHELDVSTLLNTSPRSSDSMSAIVWLGDYLSSSERDPLEDENGDLLKNKFHLRTPLISIFSRLNVNDKFTSKRFIKSVPLNNFNNFKDFAESFSNLYYSDDPKNDIVFNENHYIDFESKLKKLSDKYNSLDFTDSINRYKFILELEMLYKNYLSLVPSAAYVSESDIGLYQHSKIAAVISSSLFRYLIQKFSLNGSFNTEFNKETKKIYDTVVSHFKNKTSFVSNECALLFIKGDFSGIQEFISNISSSKALKLLKAKSTYLNLINKLIPHYIAYELGYSSLNIIYSSGGGFQLIVDNSEDNKLKLKQISTKINNFFFELFEEKIFLGLDSFCLNLSDISREHYAKVIKEKLKKLTKSKNYSKNKKFENYLKQNDFLVNNSGGDFSQTNFKICNCCKKEYVDLNQTNNALEENLCPTCNNLIQLGNSLRGNSIDLSVLNNLFPSDLVDLFKKLFGTKLNLNNFNKYSELIAVGVPLDNNKIIPFFKDSTNNTKIKTIVDYTDGFTRLAGLKLDVDNLGNLFTKGFNRIISSKEDSNNESNLSLSRYNQLSFSVSYFFEYIVELIRQKEKYKERIYTIYSGGDDSFFIGNWTHILDFSKDLNDAFRNYVDRDDITLSMSLNFFTPKYPVKKIFETLEEELYFAKHISSVVNDKGRLCLMDRTIKINSKNYTKFYELIDKLTDFVKSDLLKRTALQVIIDIILNIEKQLLSKDNSLFIPNIWNLDYYFKRNYESNSNKDTWFFYQTKIKQPIIEFCSEAVGKPILNKNLLREKINYILLALKIVQYKTRNLEVEK